MSVTTPVGEMSSWAVLPLEYRRAVARVVTSLDAPIPQILQAIQNLRARVERRSTRRATSTPSFLRNLSVDDVASPRLPTVVLDAIHVFETRGLGLVHLRGQDLAAELATSPSRLSRQLRNHTGLTFRTWHFAARLRGALLDIGLTAERMKQIAYRWGWSSVSQFNRQFKMALGVTPTEFRRGIDTTRRQATAGVEVPVRSLVAHAGRKRSIRRANAD